LTWEYYTENLEKVTVTLEPDCITMALLTDIGRLLGVLNPNDDLIVRTLEPLTEFPIDNEGLRNED